MARVETNSPLVICDESMSQPSFVDFLDGCAGVFSTRCPGKTTANEDSAAVVALDQSAGILVVADGMGGHASGEAASRTAITEMISAVTEAFQRGLLLRTGIITGFERANEAVMGLGGGAGTTLAVVELGGGLARAYHAGDSVILITGSHGKVKLETTCHSPVGYGVEAGFLDAEDAAVHEDRHVVLNAIGSGDMRIEIGSAVKLAKRDTVLLASDGLTDNLPIAAITDVVRKGPMQKSLYKLVDQCRACMVGDLDHAKPDDLTVVMFRRSVGS